MHSKYYHYIVIILTSLYSFSSHAEGTEWEYGAGIAAFNIPLYPGSSQNKQYLFPVPYLKLNTEHFEIDEGIRGFLSLTDNLLIDISADLDVPVDSNDSVIRQGMPDLDAVIQIGPSLEYTIKRQKNAGYDLKFELPLRFAFSTDIKNIQSTGWLIEPRIRIDRHRNNQSNWSTTLTVGVKYANAKYYGYYYDVTPQFSTFSRGTFVSGSGVGEIFSDLIISWRKNDVIVWTYFRYKNLSNAVFSESPLVEKNNYALIAGGVTWVFDTSI